MNEFITARILLTLHGSLTEKYFQGHRSNDLRSRDADGIHECLTEINVICINIFHGVIIIITDDHAPILQRNLKLCKPSCPTFVRKYLSWHAMVPQTQLGATLVNLYTRDLLKMLVACCRKSGTRRALNLYAALAIKKRSSTLFCNSPAKANVPLFVQQACRKVEIGAEGWDFLQHFRWKVNFFLNFEPWLRLRIFPDLYVVWGHEVQN